MHQHISSFPTLFPCCERQFSKDSLILILDRFNRPEILRMSELSDNPDLQAYSSGVLYVLSALTPLSDYVNPILDQFVTSIESSTVSETTFAMSSFLIVSQSWRTRLHGLPAVAIFFFRNLLTLSQAQIDRVLSLLLDCLSNENVEVREVASKVLSSVVRTSQRQSILPLKVRPSLSLFAC